MKKTTLLLLICAQPLFTQQAPPDWEINPPHDTTALKYTIGISAPAATEQQAFIGAWQHALRQFAESIATNFQEQIDTNSTSSGYSSDIEDEFTVTVSSSSFSTKVKLSGAREVARKVQQENGQYVARVLAVMASEDYNKARQYAENDEASTLAYRFFAQRAGGITPLDGQGKPSGFEDYYSWMRNVCVILSFEKNINNAAGLLNQLDVFVKKLYKNAAVFAETVDGHGVRIVYDSQKYYDGISRALQNVNLFAITKQDARLALAPLKPLSALSDFRAAVAALKDSSKFVITGIETIQTESGQVNSTANSIVNQFKVIASREFGLSAVNFSLPASLTDGFIDENGIVDYVKRNFAVFPARFLVLCSSETRLSASLPEYKIPPLIAASCRFTLYDTVTGEMTHSDTAGTAGFVFSPSSPHEQAVVSESRRALQFLFDAKNKPGLGGIMREVLGGL